MASQRRSSVELTVAELCLSMTHPTTKTRGVDIRVKGRTEADDRRMVPPSSVCAWEWRRGAREEQDKRQREATVPCCGRFGIAFKAESAALFDFVISACRTLNPVWALTPAG